MTQADLEARAREVLRATPHSRGENCGRPGVVFAACTCDRQFRAMLTFATEARANALKEAAEAARGVYQSGAFQMAGREISKAIETLGEKG